MRGGAGTHSLAKLLQSYAIFLEYSKIIVEKNVLYLYCNSRVGLSCIMCMFRHPLPRLLKSGDWYAYLPRCRDIQHVGQEISQPECEGENTDRKVAITRKETGYGNGYISVKVKL